MIRRLTALLIPVVFVMGSVQLTRAAPATRPAAVPRAGTPATRPAAPATRPASATPARTAAAPAPRPGAAGKAEPLPTQEEIQALYDAGDHAAVLQKLGRVLALKGAAAKPFDRHGLLRMKGECHLRLKQSAPAAAAFGDAAEAAADPKEKAVDVATELLIKRSPGLKFTAKARDKNNAPEPVDIVEPASRKSAFLALLEEELAAVTPKVKAARDAKQLTGITSVVAAVKGLRSTEIAATGSEEQTRRLVTDLASHAHNLVSLALKDYTKQVDEIYASANEILEYENITSDPNRGGAVRRETKYRKRGIERPTMDKLKGIISTCEKIGPASRDLADAFGAEIKDFNALRNEAEEVGRRATKVLKDDYRLPRA